MTPRLRLPRAGTRPPAALERSLAGGRLRAACDPSPGRVRLVSGRLLSVRLLPVPLLHVRLLPVRLLLVLAAVLLPCDTAVAYDPEPLPSDSASASATPSPSLAGTLAGEGRMRPGRPQGPATKVESQDADDPDDEGTATEPASSGAESPAGTSAQPPPREAVLAPTTPQPQPAGQVMGTGQDDDTEPMLHILPLGSGLVLIGLGLGLAFLGLRIRRG
ncbi:hypothetical protein [Streptomyces hyaluromycini]|uniref:hypothetical protein n=1 Tax=Streptomyces hyaluromycini TaxID=1377993 RepID=UPI001237FC68|nr:hypothetical protein [Streptomyces hyaluromycini]